MHNLTFINSNTHTSHNFFLISLPCFLQMELLSSLHVNGYVFWTFCFRNNFQSHTLISMSSEWFRCQLTGRWFVIEGLVFLDANLLDSCSWPHVLGRCCSLLECTADEDQRSSPVWPDRSGFQLELHTKEESPQADAQSHSIPLPQGAGRCTEHSPAPSSSLP